MTGPAFVVLVMVVVILFLLALSLPQSLLFALLTVGVIVGISKAPSRE